jgi:hypothetical protein
MINLKLIKNKKDITKKMHKVSMNKNNWIKLLVKAW